MEGRIDRRAFLAGAGAVGLGFAYGGRTIIRAANINAGPPIRGQVIRRGAPGFRQAAHVYNERYDGVLPNVRGPSHRRGRRARRR